MTLEEFLARQGIRDTMARYNMAGDRARGEDYVMTFTEDGILEGGDGGMKLEGREAIRSWMKGFGKPAPDAPPKRRPKFVRHNITTCQIDMTGPDTAKARTYYTVFTEIGPDHCGYYVDEFRKEGDRWLIARRRAMQDWAAPDSPFAPGMVHEK
jgi:hypothetical protein